LAGKTKTTAAAQQDPEQPVAVADFRRMFDEPGHIVRRLHQISVSIFVDRARELDITQIQFAALIAIGAFPGIDQTSLAKAVALDRTTISNVVRRLQTKALIRRERRNRRTNALYLTGAGQAMIQAVSPRVRSVGETLLAPLTAEERAEFSRIVKKLVYENNSLSRAPFELVECDANTPPKTPAKKSRR
jgi:DNA-binding MarR family transcriptional regulator